MKLLTSSYVIDKYCSCLYSDDSHNAKEKHFFIKPASGWDWSLWNILAKMVTNALSTASQDETQEAAAVPGEKYKGLRDSPSQVVTCCIIKGI